MSKEYSPEGIGIEDRRVFKLFKILVCVGRFVLHFVFTSGCKKEPKDTVGIYLRKKRGMTMKDYKSKFDSMMREEIDNDPSGESFDVSLLWACIKWACDLDIEYSEWHEGQDNLGSLCTTIKNMRNRICHGQPITDAESMKKKCKEISDVLEKTIKSAGSKFVISDNEINITLKEINKQISEIMKASLGERDIHALEKFREEQKRAINEIGKSELRERYRDTSKIDPASFVTGKERLHVENVFTKLEVTCEDINENYEVEYHNLFEIKNEHEKPTIIVVEGDAGAGKTTLAKLILSDWAQGSKIFYGLEQYDLVFHAEGRKTISSYIEVIHWHLPTASYKFDDADLLRSVQHLNILLIMDGFDELNTESEKLLREVSDKHLRLPRSKGLQLMITTRPRKLSDLCSMFKGHNKIQTKLRGVSLNKRVEFVTKLHNEMRLENQSKQDTQLLVDLLKHSQSRLGEHYRLPLNLTLLTYLWASDPSRVNPETTATGLYVAFLELIETRLEDRLKGQLGIVSLPEGESKEVVRKFLEVLYSVCLEMLRADSMQICSESEQVLRKKCEELRVPFHEMIEAFFVVEKEWTSIGYKTELTVPHKSILEFYAANEFLTCIRKRNYIDDPDMKLLVSQLGKYGKQKEEISEFLKRDDAGSIKSLKNICKDLLKTDKNLAKYDNMFLHLTGLLAHQCPDTLHEYCEELLQVLKEAHFKETKWLDLLVEAKCDTTLAKLLAPLIDPELIIRDGHMGAALTLFPYLDENTPVEVILENEVNYIPRLDDMLAELSQRYCMVNIFFQHQWKNSKYGSSDARLEKLLNGGGNTQGCSVNKFTGLLNRVSHLPKCLTWLKIAFTDTTHAKKLLMELKGLVECSEISYIGVHVMPGVMPEGLPPLSVLKQRKDGECGTLWLSEVDGENWKTRCEVIQALLPEGGVYNDLMFPKSNFSVALLEKILIYLKEHGIRLRKKGSIRFSSSPINKNQLLHLKTLAREFFGCALYCSDESLIW